MSSVTALGFAWKCFLEIIQEDGAQAEPGDPTELRSLESGEAGVAASHEAKY